MISRRESPHLRMLINGQMRQEKSPSPVVFDIYDQIAYLPTVMTLEPGDVLSTGTPSGVSVAMDPPSYLKMGDMMRVEIDDIGHIENTIVGAPR